MALNLVHNTGMGQTLTQQMQTDPWERQTRDTDKSWSAFRMYRNMGSVRSLAKLAAELDCTQQNVAAWSQRHDWVNRVRAYDAHIQGIVDREQEKEHAQQLRDMAERHTRAAVQFQEMSHLMGMITNARLAKLTQPLMVAIAAGKTGDDLPDVEIPKDLATFAKATAEISARAGESEAMALGVDRLLSMLEGGE